MLKFLKLKINKKVANEQQNSLQTLWLDPNWIMAIGRVSAQRSGREKCQSMSLIAYSTSHSVSVGCFSGPLASKASFEWEKATLMKAFH